MLKCRHEARMRERGFCEREAADSRLNEFNYTVFRRALLNTSRPGRNLLYVVFPLLHDSESDFWNRQLFSKGALQAQSYASSIFTCKNVLPICFQIKMKRGCFRFRLHFQHIPFSFPLNRNSFRFTNGFSPAMNFLLVKNERNRARVIIQVLFLFLV